MSRGGGNPNWEYQLVSPIGHTNDLGLRQRALVNGIKYRNVVKKVDFKAKKKPARKPKFDLSKIFGGNK